MVVSSLVGWYGCWFGSVCLWGLALLVLFVLVSAGLVRSVRWCWICGLVAVAGCLLLDLRVGVFCLIVLLFMVLIWFMFAF